VPTLLLTRSVVERLVDPAALVPDLRAAFRAYSTAPALRAQRVRSSLGDAGGSATVLFPGMVTGIPAYTVKVHAKFPEQHPAIRGVLCLHDARAGELLAVMDSTHLTAVRTGLAGAIAADVLARPGADTVAVVGAGVQGEHQLRSLAMLRALRMVRAYDTRHEQAQAFAIRMSDELGIAVDASASLDAAVREADIVLAATWARTPFLFPPMLKPGVHVTTLGADEPGKCEVAAEVLHDAVVVCDDRDLAVRMGAVGGAGLGPDAVDAELGEVLAGVHPGRAAPTETTVYGGVGLAFQDLVVAWQVYRRAVAQRVGHPVDFLS